MFVSRFFRQLSHLKSIVNYSQIDPTGIADFLLEASEDNQDSGSLHNDNHTNVENDRSKDTSDTALTIDSSMPTVLLTQYTYNLLSHGVTRQILTDLTDEDLALTCHIENSIHRKQILKAVKKACEFSKYFQATL